MAIDVKTKTEEKPPQMTMEDTGGMSSQTATTPPPAQTGAQPQQSSESSTIQTGGATQYNTQKATNAPKKGVGSGMASKLNKYKAANTNQVGKMTNKMTQNVQKRVGDIKAIKTQKEKTFADLANPEKARLSAGSKFSKDLVNRGSNVVDMSDLERQKAGIQKRMDAFGNIDRKDYTGDINASRQNEINQAASVYGTDYVTEKYGDQAKATNTSGTQQQNMEQARDKLYKQQQDQEASKQYLIDNVNMEDFNPVDNTWGSNSKNTYGTDAYNQDVANDRNQDILADYNRRLGLIGKDVPSWYGPSRQYTKEDLFKGDQLENLDTIRANESQYQQLAQTTKDYEAAKQAFENGQIGVDQLSEVTRDLEDKKRLVGNRSNIDTEMATIQEKIDKAPQSLTEEELSKFDAYREGTGTFQKMRNIDLSKERSKSGALESLASRIPTEQGQQELLRNIVDRSDYSRGQSNLDSFLIGSNKDSRENLIRGVQGSTKGLTQTLDDTERASGKQLGVMRDQAGNIKRQIDTDLTAAEEGVTSNINKRLETGEGTMVADIQKRLESGSGLTPEQMAVLGLDKDSNTYDYDLNKLKYNKDDYSAADVTNMSDLAKSNALASLRRRDQTLIANSDQVKNRINNGELANADARLTGEANDAMNVRRNELERINSRMVQGSQVQQFANEYNTINASNNTNRGKDGQMADLLRRSGIAGGKSIEALAQRKAFDDKYKSGNISSESGLLQRREDFDPSANAEALTAVQNAVYRDKKYYEGKTGL